MKIQSIALGIVVILIIAGGLVAVQAGNDETGNMAPSGKHYTLNILGKDWDKADTDPLDADDNPYYKDDNGHRIFVKLGNDETIKKTRILLYNSLTTEEATKDFQVLDADGTDGKAAFALPPPGTVVDETTGEVTSSAYTVWIRILGPPRGQADMYSGFMDDSGNQWLSFEVIELRQYDEDPPGPSDPDHKLVTRKSPPKFEDVTKELTTVYYDSDGDLEPDARVSLFDPDYYQYFWDYDNQGLKHVQIRFYDYNPAE